MPIIFAAVTNAAQETAAQAVTEGQYNFSYDGDYGQDQIDAAAAIANDMGAAGSYGPKLSGIKPGLVLEWTHEAAPDADTEWKPIVTLTDNEDDFIVELEAGSVRCRIAGTGDSATSMVGRLD